MSPSRSRLALAGGALAAALGLSLATVRGHELPEGAASTRAIRADLVWTAEVDGELATRERVDVGPPPVPNTEFKLAFVAEEGAEVKAGEVLLRFDTQLLEERLQRARSEVSSYERNREKRDAELESQRLEAERQRLEAVRRLEKARLQADVPPGIVALVELEKARLEVESAEGEAARLTSQIEASRRRGEAELADLTALLERARREVEQLERDIEAMTVRARRSGVVVLPSNRRGEKRGVGDSVWMGETLIQLPDLGALLAEGYVPESDAGALAVGQPVRLRLDSREGQELRGTLSAVGRSVRPRSWRVRNLMVRVEIELEEAGEGLRPGMRFRGEIETAREPGVLQLPLGAIFARPEGPVAWRCGLMGCRETPLVLGRRSAAHVEVLSGLAEGDEVAREDLLFARNRGA